jgi:hypothetical protein
MRLGEASDTTTERNKRERNKQNRIQETLTKRIGKWKDDDIQCLDGKEDE